MPGCAPGGRSRPRSAAWRSGGENARGPSCRSHRPSGAIHGETGHLWLAAGAERPDDSLAVGQAQEVPLAKARPEQIGQLTGPGTHALPERDDRPHGLEKRRGQGPGELLQTLAGHDVPHGELAGGGEHRWEARRHHLVQLVDVHADRRAVRAASPDRLVELMEQGHAEQAPHRAPRSAPGRG